MQRVGRESKHLEDFDKKDHGKKKLEKIDKEKAKTGSIMMVVSPDPLKNIMENKKTSQLDPIVDKLNGMNIDYSGEKPSTLDVNQLSFYLDRENKSLIHNYGPELYDYSRELENISVFPDFLRRHKIDPVTRTRMIDWMIEVLYAYNCDAQTFYLSVHILDTYIAKTKTVLNNFDVHLIGIVSIFIASKMEDLIPLRMSHIKSKIAHNKFSDKELKKSEKTILETLNFEIITTSTYDFLKTFIFDFIHNNRDYIISLNMFRQLDIFDNIAVYLSKMMAHSEEFSQYKYIIFNYLGTV